MEMLDDKYHHRYPPQHHVAQSTMVTPAHCAEEQRSQHWGHLMPDSEQHTVQTTPTT